MSPAEQTARAALRAYCAGALSSDLLRTALRASVEPWLVREEVPDAAWPDVLPVLPSVAREVAAGLLARGVRP